MEYKNLTYLQKVALKGELSATFSGAHSNADLKFKIFRILKQVEAEQRPLFQEAIKETVELDEGELDRLSFCVTMSDIPLSLWVQKTIDDIKYYLKAPEVSFKISNVSTNKKEERKEILNSAFINFGRKVLLTSTTATVELVNKILEENELEFLHTSCAYLLDGCSEINNFKCCSKEETDISEDILKMEFDPFDIMAYSMETHCLNKLNEPYHEVPKAHVNHEESPVKIIKISTDMDINENLENISEEELSQFFGKHIAELIKSVENSSKNESEGSSELCYVVQKKYKNTNIKQNIQKFKSEKEALAFIKKIREEKPELSRTCEFIIRKEIIEK